MRMVLSYIVTEGNDFYRVIIVRVAGSFTKK